MTWPPASALRTSAAGTWCAVALVAIFCALTGLRIADLVSNRYYVVSASTSSFGPGESWSFPERAAAFIEREQLPGNIFQPYNLGGFTALRLGPHYLDYIDGRGVSQRGLRRRTASAGAIARFAFLGAGRFAPRYQCHSALAGALRRTRRAST